jgi:hypothetical protein
VNLVTGVKQCGLTIDDALPPPAHVPVFNAGVWVLYGVL